MVNVLNLLLSDQRIATAAAVPRLQGQANLASIMSIPKIAWHHRLSNVSTMSTGESWVDQLSIIAHK